MYGSRRTCEVALIGTNRPTSGTVMPTPTRCAGAWTCAERGTAERATAQATATGFVCMGPPGGEWVADPREFSIARVPRPRSKVATPSARRQARRVQTKHSNVPSMWTDRRRLTDRAGRGEDRKSTRLNSSHLGISYAVFCLKKKSNQLHLHA